MTPRGSTGRWLGIMLAAAAMLSVCAAAARAQSAPPDDGTQPAPADQKATMDIYGFAMLDNGYQVKSNDPNWFDVLRPTKLPASQDQFGKDGHWFSSVRQSRLGVRSSLPTDLGELKTIFEFELFGTGVDAGQTTFRLRHAWGEVKHFGAGQTWSPFMDPDVFPNSLEYWGPNGMVFFRNVQARWMPLGDSSLMFAIERPGASADQGVYADRVELQNVKPRFPLPDLSGAYKASRSWGYVRGAFLVGEMKWDDLNPVQFNLSGSAARWGFNFSSNLKVMKSDTVRLQYAFGHGIENYMNDAPVDVGIQSNPGNAVTPIVGKALPVRGLVAFYDRTWNEKFTSSFGYSQLGIDNTDGQKSSEFKAGQYALVNLLYTPVQNVMTGGEFQWGRRENFSDGWSVNDYRLQFSFKYNFSYKLGG
ncbi:MAG TPA: DcaP family trimeric outer membrane transporter [Vicinamibacterales bacterium]|nr:DcaP family trimeric outer membrane transporter [Vicinamibacterales bacterium]